MGGEIKPIAELVGEHREYAKAAAYVTGLDVLPTNRVINDAKVTDHHAIIPTNSEHRSDKMSDDDRRSTTWSPAASSPSSIPRPCSRTRAWRRPSRRHIFRTRGRVLLVAGWRGVYGEEALDSGAQSASDDDEGGPTRPRRGSEQEGGGSDSSP